MVVVLVAGAAVAAGFGATPTGEAAPAAAPLPGECPPVMPVEEVEAGMTGTGLSVVQGRDPAKFKVDVLGVLQDGIAPGRDMIVVNLSGPVIDAAGGLWFGASGSPVYLRNPDSRKLELAGAVAFGLAFGQSSLAGLTPAEDMVDLLDAGAGGAALAETRESVRIPRGLAARMATTAGLSTAAVSGLTRLKAPLSISGLNDRALKRVQAALDRQNLPFVPYAGASVSTADSGESAGLGPGDSIAAALSLGDVTAAAVGTTTFVCSGRVVGFGHPFFFGGETTMAARAADTITIVQDLFGSYKLANVAENAGTVTADHLAGIVAELGEAPATSPVTSVVTDLDRGVTRNGESRAVLPEFMPFLAFSHLLSNIDVTIDRIGPGSSQIAYSITGTRGDGSAWELARTDRYVSRFDISFDSVWEIAFLAEILLAFEDEGVAITAIDVERADVERAVREYRLSRVLVWNGRAYVKSRSVSARPGGKVRLRALLTSGSRERKVDLALRVPRWLRQGGFIEVSGGGSSSGEIPCFVFGEECGGGEAATFDNVLEGLQKQPSSDVLSVRLHAGRRLKQVAKDTERQDAVVFGRRVVRFKLAGSLGPVG